MNDLMFDLEALGTNSNGLITQIGACYFDRFSGEVGDTFLANISIADSLRLGFGVTSGSLDFWLEQRHNITFLKDRQPLTKALESFRGFAKSAKTAWSHATFDPILLNNAYDKVGQGHPIPYRNIRDIRTLVDLAKVPYKKPTEEKLHDALQDCLYQVKYCVECFRAIEKKQSWGISHEA